MIHYENMTKEQVISILKDTEEYIGEVHKDYDVQKEEIERLNNIINQMEQFFIDNANDEMKKCFDKLHSLKKSNKRNKEIERLHSIIKEVRECILKEDEWVKNSDYRLLKTDKLLEILDKENE